MTSFPRSYRDLLGRYLRPHRRLATVLILLVAANIGLQLLNPQILRSFIDSAQRGSSLRSLTLIALAFLAVAVGTQIATIAETYIAENLGWLATNRLRADLALHCLRLDPSTLDTFTPGELIERIDGDVTALSNFFSRFVVYIFGNILLLLGVLVLLFRIDWRIGLVMAAFTMVAAVITLRIRELAAPRWNAGRQSSAELMGFIEERLAGTEDIRASGAVSYTMRRYYSRARDLLVRMRTAALVSSSVGWVTILLLAGATASGLGLGAYFYQQGALTIGTVYLIFAYSQMLNRPIDEITRQIDDFQQAAASVQRIGGLLTLRSRITDGARSLPAGPLAVELERVTFTYDGAIDARADGGSGDPRPALRDVSLHLEPGEVLGVLGHTGSGKTTLSRLLFRLYDPTAGVIRLGGIDLREASTAAIRARVGMVTQDVQLFHASVRDNLTLFSPDVPDARIRGVIEEVGLAQWLAGLPQELDTTLAAGGSGLSAGQAQLLAFARVFLREPGLVILDEASSRLDPATEQQMERAIDRLLANRTAIIIAHRLHTVHRADSILILNGGRVEEYGRRHDLAGDSESRFSQFLHAGTVEALA